MKTNPILDSLVASGTIKSYVINNLNNEGEIGHSKFRNTEQLIITFSDDRTLKIDTFCSGSAEDTALIFQTL